MSGADVGAAAALHAQLNLFLVQDGGALVLILQLHGLGKGGGIQAQGAGGHAAAAVDAGAGLRLLGVFLIHDDDGVGGLDDRLVHGAGGFAHHGAAVDDLARLALQPAGLLHQIADGGADGDDQVLGLLDGGAVHCDALFHQRHTVFNILGHLGQGSDVDNNHVQLRKTLALGHHLAGGVIEQHLLCTLGIDALQGHDVHGAVACKYAAHLLNGVGLVLLNADNELLGLQILSQQLHALDDIAAVFHHGAVVAGDVGLALRAVDQNGLNGVAAYRVQLRPQRKCCSAQTYDAAFLHCGEEAVQIVDLRRDDVGVLLHLAVALDADGKTGPAAVRCERLNSLDCT